MGKDGKSHLKPIKHRVFVIGPSCSDAQPTHLPRGASERHKVSKNTTEMTNWAKQLFNGTVGEAPLRTIKCEVFVSLPTLSTSWGGLSPIRDPRGPPQSPKVTKNTIEIT